MKLGLFDPRCPAIAPVQHTRPREPGTWSLEKLRELPMSRCERNGRSLAPELPKYVNDIMSEQCSPSISCHYRCRCAVLRGHLRPTDHVHELRCCISLRNMEVPQGHKTIVGQRGTTRSSVVAKSADPVAEFISTCHIAASCIVERQSTCAFS